MKFTKTGTPFLLPLVCFAAAWLLLNLLLVLTCEAHGPTYKKPRPVPPQTGSPPPPKANLPPPSVNSPGKPAVPTRPATPGTGAPKGSPTGTGGQARKNRGASTASAMTWEDWWARNRHQFLVFPKVSEQIDSRYPATPDSNSSAAALETLRAQTVEMIRPLLSDRSARLRRMSLIGLAMLDDGDSLPAMLEMLQDGNQTVRDAAVLGLGLMNKREAKHTLLHIAKGSTTGCEAVGQTMIPDYFRGFAQISLALENTTGLSSMLQSVAHDPHCSAEVRAMALEGIGLLGGEEATRFLVQYSEKTKVDPRILAAAVTAACKTGDPVLLPFLEKCLRSKHVAVKQSAALGLGYLAPLADRKVIDLLIRCHKQEKDQALRGFSLVSLGLIGGSRAAQYLDHQMMRGDRAGCAWACIGLGLACRKVKDPKLESHLIQQATSHANRSVRSAAAIALGLMKSSRAVFPLIEKFQKGDDPVYRTYCALALGMLGDQAAVEPLRHVITMESRENTMVKSQAVMALALLRDTESVPDMIKLMLESKNDFTKGFISLSLGYMGDVRIVETLLDAAERPSDDITLLHCIHLTAKLISGRTQPYLDRVAAGSNIASEYPIVGYLLDYDI